MTGICEAGNGLRFAKLMKNRLSGYGGVEESHDPIRIVSPLGPNRPIVILPGRTDGLDLLEDSRATRHLDRSFRFAFPNPSIGEP